MQTGPLISSANQWTGFYMITASVMKGLNSEKMPTFYGFEFFTFGLEAL